MVLKAQRGDGQRRWRGARLGVGVGLAVLTAVMGAPPNAAAAQMRERTFVVTMDGVKTWITVVRRGGHQPPLSESVWWKWGNTTHDEYLFAFGGSTNARLLLAFSQNAQGRLTAALYTNDLGHLPLKYRLDPQGIRVLSGGGHPYVVLDSRTGGWVEHGRTNYDVTLWVDGLSGMGYPKVLPNGHFNTVYRVGQKSPGIPEWEVGQNLGNPQPQWGYPRLEVQERLPGAPPFRVMPGVMPDFPYLGVGTTRQVDWFLENPSPLYFDLSQGQLMLYSFVGFENGGTYRINSVAAAPHPDFESPFAFYNFVPDSRHAQLVVRSDTYPAGDRFGFFPAIHRDETSFRYSWAGANPALFSYSLQLAGSIPLDQTVSIGGVRFRGIKPNDLPSWVMAQKWPMVAFVQSMTGYASSEGIYSYTPQQPAAWPWLLGLTAHPAAYWSHPALVANPGPATSDQGLAVGYRGEYDAEDFRPPKLYISPVDGLVHLLWAEGGVWNLGRGWYEREENLTGGPYLDVWELKHLTKQRRHPRAQGGKTVAAVYQIGQTLVYQGPTTLEIRRTTARIRPTLVNPPTNRTSWERFRQLTAKAETGRSPFDMAAWVASWKGPSVVWRGAALTDVRVAGGHWTWVLHLTAATKVSAATPGLPPLTPGTYLLTYHPAAGRWSAISHPVAAVHARVVLSPVVFGQVATVTIRWHNRGGLPARTAVEAVIAGARRVRHLTTGGGASGKVILPWPVREAGPTKILVRFDGRLVMQRTVTPRRVGRVTYFLKSLPSPAVRVGVGIATASLLALMGGLWQSTLARDAFFMRLASRKRGG
ncbi:MAG: hypothetical protein OWU84_06190 [Firmicutes bacterium]|nr:hypothetical protein [Bacillota bacterium]